MVDRVLTPKQQAEYDKLLEALDYYDIEGEDRRLILEAYHAEDWDWTECDGCTLVDEGGFAKGYRHPACVRHDYDCYLVRKGEMSRKEGDARFKRNLRLLGMHRTRAWGRWFGVRSFWVCVQKWRDRKYLEGRVVPVQHESNHWGRSACVVPV